MEEELKTIVQRMLDSGESEEDIALVIRNYKPIKAKLSASVGEPVKQITPGGFGFESLLKGEDLAQGVSMFNRGATQVVPDILNVVGAAEQTLGGVGYASKAGEAVQKGIEYLNPVTPEFQQSTTGQVLQGIGQVVPLVATGGGSTATQLGTTGFKGAIRETAKAIGKQVTSAQGVMAGSMVAAPEWKQAKEAGLSDEDAFKTLIKNYFVGQTEALPIQNALSRLNAVSGGKILNLVKASGLGGLEEAIQEGIQTYLTNQIAKEDYDPNRDPMFQVLESSKIGGIVGLIIPSIGIAMQKAPADVKDKVALKIAELQGKQDVKSAKLEAIDKAIAQTSTGNPAIDIQQDVITDQTLKPNAVQEQTASQVPVQPETQAGQEVAQGTPQAEPQTTTSQGEVNYQQAIEKAKQSPNLEVTEVDDKLRVKILNEQGSKEAQELSYLSKTRGSTQSENTEFRAPETSTVKGDIRETIRPSSEKVTTSEYSLLKDKIRNIARGVRMGNIDAKKAVKDVGKNISEIIEKQQLPAKQQNAILKRATSVNFNNPDQVNKLLDYTDKVVADAAYDDKLNKAKSRAKDIKSKSNKGRFASFTPAVQRLLQIDPETLNNVDLETYQTVVDELDKKNPNIVPLRDNLDRLINNSFEDPSVTRVTSVPQLREYIGGIEQVTDIDTFSAAKRKINQAKKKLYDLANSGTVDETEAESFALEIDNLNDKLNQATEQFEETSKSFKKDRISQAKEVLNSLPEYSKQDTEQIDKFKNIDLSDRTVPEVEDYYQIAEGLSNGFLNKAMYDFISKNNKQKNIEEYKTIAQKASAEWDKVRTFFGLFNVKGINPAKDPRKLLNQLKLLHGQRWDRKLLLGKDRPINEKIFTPINARVAKAETVTNTEQKKVKELTSSLNETSRQKVGMILNQLDYISSDYKEGMPKDKMRFLLSDPISYEDAKPVAGNSTLDKYKEIWKGLPKDANGDIDVEKSINSLTAKEKEALYGIKDKVFGDPDFQGKAKVITEMRGEVWKQRPDYFTNIVTQRVRKGKDADVSSDSFVDDALSLDRKGLGVRSGRTYQRTGKLYFTELDIAKVANRAIKEVNRDYYLTEAIRDKIGSMNTAASEMEGSQRGMFDAMYQAMKDRVVTEYNLKFTDSDPLNDFTDWYLSFRRTMALSNPMRAPYDFTANMVRQGVAEGFNASGFTNPLWAELKKNNDSIVTGKTNKYRQEQVKPTETKSGQLADDLMGLGDTPVVNIAYVTSFKNKFEELTGQKFNIQQYNDPIFREQNAENIAKSSSFADAKVQDLFNSQSTFMAPSKTKITPLHTKLTDKKTLVAKMLGFMQSFTTNEAAEVMQSFKDLSFNTNEGRVKAARRIAAMGMSNYVYMNGALVMLNMLRAAVDDEKELTDLLEEQFSPRKQFEILLASTGSLIVGRYGNLVRPIMSLFIGGLYDILKRGDFDNKEELKEDIDTLNDISNTAFYTGPPISLRYDKPEKILRLIPVLGDAMADAFVLGNTVTDLLNKEPETMTEEERAQLDLLILLNKTAAFAYKNPISPTIDRLLRAKKQSISTPKVTPPEGFIEPGLPDLPPLPEPYENPSYEPSN